MRFFSLISSLALATTSLAHPVDQHNAEHSDIHARQSTTGNPDVRLEGGKGGAVQPRLEIRQLRNTQPEQWNIFLVAMNRWMTSSRNNQRYGPNNNVVGLDDSYFGIASIHGVPQQNYAGVGQCASCSGADGYCTHDSVLFPAWHRAYMALFEQEFLKIAVQVSREYNQQRYTSAGNNLRFPYFDWAARPPNNGPALPTLITDSQVTVQGPGGQQTFRNPLYGYQFIGGQQNTLLYGILNGFTKTLRYPTSNSPAASNNSPASAAAFSGARQSLQDQVYQLFTSCRSYLYFSNDDSRASSARCANSIEQIHNTVHNTAGGLGGNGVSGGHMTYLSTAAFDPIFWLHHGNIDRIFAMWQQLNPNSYGDTQAAPHTTWTIQAGSRQGPTSGLRPFRRVGADNFWNTNNVRDWRQFGYTYPEFANSDGSANAISGYVNRLYGPNPSATAGSSKRDADADAEPDAEPQLLGALVDTLGDTLGDIMKSNPLKASNGSLYQYVANIKTPRYALGGSYTVYLFNGKPASEDPATWPAADNLYGPMGLLSQEMQGTSGMNMSILTSGSIPLTTKLTGLFQNSLLGSLSELVVAPFLAANLEWRIAKDGQSVDPTTIPGFVVTVVTSSAQPPADANSFPVYSEFIELLGVTRGQAGGANTTQFTSIL